MGSTGRAIRSMVGYTTPIPTPQPQPQQPQPNNITQQVPNAQNTPVVPGALNALSKMNDDQMASLLNSALNVKLPNMLNDSPDATQSFVFVAGLNEKPMVLDSAEFNKYMQDNKISQREILARSVNGISYKNASNTTIKLSGDQINNIIKYSRLTYIGGKQGGQAYGAGTYFDKTGGRNTGYGGTTMEAVLNPATAKPIYYGDINSKWASFVKTHPKTDAAVNKLVQSYVSRGGRRNDNSIKALLMGYNVITDNAYSPSYHNIIDRSALVIKA